MESEIIYKYRDWTNTYHRELLYENEIYLSSPKDFNDPFDCRIHPNLKLLDTEEKRTEFANKQIISNFQRLENEGINIEDALNNLSNRLSKDLPREDDFYSEISEDFQNRNYGVLSLSLLWDSILMWSYYGNNHQGFCLGFNRKKLEDSGLFGKGGPVMYKEDYPSIDPLDDDLIKIGFIETHTKAKKWCHEEEYRFFHLNPDGFSQKERKIKLNDEFFEELILGVNFPHLDIEKAQRIAESKQMKLYQTVRIKGEFKLERQQI